MAGCGRGAVTSKGQLGDGTLSNKLVPQQVPNLPAIKQISAGIGHVLGLASDATVGLGCERQGPGRCRVESRGHVTHQGVQADGITQVSAGNEFSLAVGPNGIVPGLGRQPLQTVGFGRRIRERLLAVPARHLTNIIQVVAGADQWPYAAMAPCGSGGLIFT
jgi:hypothetical protein